MCIKQDLQLVEGIEKLRLRQNSVIKHAIPKVLW